MSIERLNNVFREVFQDSELSIFSKMSAHDVAAWDSFNHINLVIAIETEFEVRFTTQEIGDMRNVGDLVAALQTKGCDVTW